MIHKRFECRMNLRKIFVGTDFHGKNGRKPFTFLNNKEHTEILTDSKNN